MLELITTPLFLIVAALFAVFLVIGIAKRAVRFLLWALLSLLFSSVSVS